MPFWCSSLLAAAAWLTLSASATAEATPVDQGAMIYQSQCADCHGPHGEGGDGFARPLTGPLTVVELADLVERTMPEGEPEACTGEQALAVARYMHGRFYSSTALLQNAPRPFELTHLTVRQYEQTILDLAQSLTWRGKRDDRVGLTAEFFQGPGARRESRVHDAVVRRVDFGMLDSGLFDREKLFPSEEETKADVQGAARRRSVLMKWSGAVRADHTGDYEFIVRTNAGFRLWVNGPHPLIDKRVQSGEDQGGRATVRLLEGRQYPLRLEVTRVFEDDVHTQLAWRPPAGEQELIPARVLTPHMQPAQLVLKTRLPPDDRSLGFERGAGLSARWDEATTYAGLEAADAVVEMLPTALKLPQDADRAREAVRVALLEFADRAFRRPLTDDEAERIVNKHFQSDLPWREAARYALLTTLKSPQFLYPEVGVASADANWRAAARLSLALWDSAPDEPLRRAAQQGKLSEREQIRRQAEWMTQDPRASAKLLAFLRDWLDVQEATTVERDPNLFGGFSTRVAADMRTSLELFLQEFVESEEADFRDLFRSQKTYLNDRLATFLGAPSPGGEEFRPQRLEPAHRSGVVTHPYIVASHAYYRETSPIHRGVFLARRMLGRPLAPPPEAIAPTPPESQPGLTTRERVSLQTSPHACQHCHMLINDLGFSLEHFDAAGRFREDERGKPIVTTGAYTTQDGQQRQFENARELAELLSQSEDVQRAFVIQLLEYCSKQPAATFGKHAIDELLESFRQHQFNIRKTMAEIALVIATHRS